MVKLFFTCGAVDRGYLDDPLAHPDLASMTLEQLADLPFEPYALVPCAEETGVRAPAFMADFMGRLVHAVGRTGGRSPRLAAICNAHAAPEPENGEQGF